MLQQSELTQKRASAGVYVVTCGSLSPPLGRTLESIVSPTQAHEGDREEHRAAGALKHYWEKLSDKRKTNKNDIIPVSFLACNTQRESHKELIILC